MYNKYYYARTLWGVEIALLDMFNDMTIYRFDKERNIVKSIDVPITTGPIEKMQAMGEVNHPSDTTRYYQHVPKMSLVLNGINHDASRAYSSDDERFWLDDKLSLDNGDSVYSDFQPTPYNFTYTLFIRSDSMEDLAQILENILPYCNPSFMLRVKEFLFLNIERDLPTKLETINLDFTNSMDQESMREVNANLDFTVEGWMYKPVTSAALVKIINSDLFVGYDNYILDSSIKTEGYYTESQIPTSGYNTSGYNANTEVYWTETIT